jgi:hypothetical protein
MDSIPANDSNNDGAECAAAAIADLVPTLLEAGVEKVFIDYDGNDGEGTIDICSRPDVIPEAVRTELQTRASSLLPADWNEEDGSLGSMVLDVDRRTIEIEHYRRESTEDEETWLLTLPDLADTALPKTDDEKAAIAKITELFPALREAGITDVLIDYDGCGDSGTVGNITPATIPQAVQDRLEEYAHTILPGGWETNEGSHGVIIIDVANETITVDHAWRSLDTGDVTKLSYGLF